MDRRAFLQTLLRAPKRPGAGAIRPPYAPPGADFSACARCDAPCVSACPQGILERDAGGAPEVRFRAQGCTFCTACAEACPHGVLSPEGPARIPARAHIDPGRCTAWQHTLCFVCLEACPEEAIVMSREVELASFDRESMIFHKEQLLVPEPYLKRRLEFLRAEYEREDAPPLRRDPLPSGEEPA